MYGKIIRAEANVGTGIQFDGSKHVGEVLYSGMSYANKFVFNNPTNKAISHTPNEPDQDKPRVPNIISGAFELRSTNGYDFSGAETGTARGNANGFGIAPTDLSTVGGGDFDGQIRPDDGTNTAARGVLCSRDAENSVWRKPDGTAI